MPSSPTFIYILFIQYMYPTNICRIGPPLPNSKGRIHVRSMSAEPGAKGGVIPRGLNLEQASILSIMRLRRPSTGDVCVYNDRIGSRFAQSMPSSV